MPPRSIWVATTPASDCPRLEHDISTDVAVVGGGILGITCAHVLSEAGHQVAVLEAGRILEGVTGHTTGKLTSQHGMIYRSLEKRLGADKARLHAEANEQGRRHAVDTIRRLGIDAHLEEAPAYVYTTDARRADELRAEAKAAQGAGLDASFTTKTELPFEVAGAVRQEGQAHFHPREYLLALAQRVQENGGAIYENSPVTAVGDGEPCKLRTSRGVVEAKHIIVATNVPINDRAFFAPRMEPRRAYGIAGPAEARVDGMYINIDEPVRSIRPYRDRGEDMLVFVGDNHTVGTGGDTREHIGSLRRFADDFGLGEVRYEWSTQDYYPFDGLPYIGRYSVLATHVHTATGFQGWGLSQATAAALLFERHVAGEKRPWSDLYDPFSPTRVVKDLVEPSFIKTQASIAKGFVKSRVVHSEMGHLAPGEGEVADVDGQKLAIHRDEQGKLHVRLAKCPHMGCFVAWNRFEKSWDCPCHGSRYAPDGTVLHGPATQGLGEAEARAREAVDARGQ